MFISVTKRASDGYLSIVANSTNELSAQYYRAYTSIPAMNAGYSVYIGANPTTNGPIGTNQVFAGKCKAWGSGTAA